MHCSSFILPPCKTQQRSKSCPCTISDWVRLSHLIVGAYERGYSRYISRGPGEPRRVCESLMDPIAYAIDVLFWYFHFLVYIQHSWGPNAVLFRLAKFLLEALLIVLCRSVQLFKTAISSNCAPLLADLFLYSYESEFLQKLVKDKKIHEARAFNFTFRYIDDVLSINNSRFA